MPSEKTDYVFDPATPTIVMTRLFDTPRRLVWDAMTKPEYLKRWYGPPENESTYEVDLRPGGSHRFANKSQWGEFVSTGVPRGHSARAPRLHVPFGAAAVPGVCRHHDARREGRQDDDDHHDGVRLDRGPRRLLENAVRDNGEHRQP